MEFAVNYSPTLAGLVRDGLVDIDRYKCPAWPDLLAEAGQSRPVYVHFPLTIGSGLGYAVNEERKQPVDLDWLAGMLEASGTPFINTHFIADGRYFPDIPIDSREPWHIRRVLDAAMRDLEPLVRRFGAERVMVENVINEYGWLTLGVLPETLAALLEETGCGFLLDLSHARLAARNLGLEERAYTASLPVERIREVHVTGLRAMEGPLLERILAAGNPGEFAGRMAGKWMDHLPMTEADWPEIEWMAGEIRSGRWPRPWAVGYEYGGVGGFWEMVTERQVYLEELPRYERILADLKDAG